MAEQHGMRSFLVGELNTGVQVEHAVEAQSAILHNLIQLYIHDFTQHIEIPIGPDGLFDYPRLPLYWTEPERHPYIIRASGRLAGFALVKKGSEFSGRTSVWDMAEFFVLRGERGRGVGTAACVDIWNQLSGPWEVRVMPENHGALHFWRRTISRFLGRDLEPMRADNGVEYRSLFLFESPPPLNK